MLSAVALDYLCVLDISGFLFRDERAFKGHWLTVAVRDMATFSQYIKRSYSHASVLPRDVHLSVASIDVRTVYPFLFQAFISLLHHVYRFGVSERIYD